MPHHNTVLHAVLKHVPWDQLDDAVERHGAAAQARRFSFKSQLTAMLFAQLSGATSLRHVTGGLQSQAHRLYHLGVDPARRSTLADANRDRPADIFADLLGVMIKRAHRGLRRAMDGATTLIDSTNLMLGAGGAAGRVGWARFSANACGVKLHVAYDPDADCPTDTAITGLRINDITPARAMPITPGATYVFDLGYYSYAWWAELDAAGCRIVTRLKAVTRLDIIETRPLPPGSAILSDRVGTLPTRQSAQRRNPMSKPLREVRVRLDTGRILRIVSNDLHAPAQTIADLYKRRWAVELFFRWVKQTLRIDRFMGTSENAVRTQIVIALIAFLLLRLTQRAQSHIKEPLAFARLVRLNLLHRRPINQLAQRPPPKTHCAQQSWLFSP